MCFENIFSAMTTYIKGISLWDKKCLPRAGDMQPSFEVCIDVR